MSLSESQTPQTFIFIGRSGSGKGTQVDRLVEYLQQTSPANPIFRAETGKRFRDFIERANYTSKLSGVIYEKGGIQPEFLAIAMWANAFIEGLRQGEHIVLDGCPRKMHEAQVLHSAMKFYGRISPVATDSSATDTSGKNDSAAPALKPHIIYINVGDVWARERLMARHRVDDTEEDIKVRLGWYETEVKPTVEFYRKHPDYHLVEVNGEQAIEKVHADIMKGIQES